MEQSVDELQKHMGVIKQVKDQLSSLSLQGAGPRNEGIDMLKQEGDSLKRMIPKF